MDERSTMNITRKARTFFFIATRRPAQAWELLQIRAERRTGLTFFFLSARRSITYAYELFRTSAVNRELHRYGNYYLAPAFIPEHPVAFSLGVGQDIDFDRALFEKHDVRLFLFDPTPASKRFIDSVKLPLNAQFLPYAIADYDGRISMFSDDLQQEFDKTSSVSIFNRGFYKKESASSVECRKISSLMRELNIQHLDILKLDIEGAAIQVLEDLFREGVFPTQIACEFERPEKLKDVFQYLTRMSALFDQFEAAGYQLYRTRPNDHGCQIEILAVRDPVRAGI
jgi:FkbM family methyltransferase